MIGRSLLDCLDPVAVFHTLTYTIVKLGQLFD
jgi:hypothetical protein